MFDIKEIIGKTGSKLFNVMKFGIDALTGASFILIYWRLICMLTESLQKMEAVDVGKGDIVPFWVYALIRICELLVYTYIGYVLLKHLFRIRTFGYHILDFCLVWGILFIIHFALILY